MKTPLDPQSKDLADAMGSPSRRKRDEDHSIALAERSFAEPHTHTECSEAEALALIERALSRLSSGTYGTCVACGADISLSRLDRNPAIETCAACSHEASFKAC